MSPVKTSAAYDREMIIDEFKPLSKAARERWDRARESSTRTGAALMNHAAGHTQLLRRIKEVLPRLTARLEQSTGHDYEDRVYRFYHHSSKVFHLQSQTSEIVSLLKELMPDRSLNAFFMEIVKDGTGREFSVDQNSEWTRHTRPIVEAFFHARYFLEMAVRYASLTEPPSVLPSGWAALLTLYDLR